MHHASTALHYCRIVAFSTVRYFLMNYNTYLLCHNKNIHIKIYRILNIFSLRFSARIFLWKFYLLKIQFIRLVHNVMFVLHKLKILNKNLASNTYTRRRHVK